MKTVYIVSHQGSAPHVLMLDDEQSAWDMAFKDLDNSSGFPMSIVAPAQTYERLEILERWRESRRQSAPAEIETDIAPRRREILFPADDSDQLYARLPAARQKEIADRAVAQMPEFVQKRYRAAIQEGKDLRDFPALWFLFKELRNTIMEEK